MILDTNKTMCVYYGSVNKIVITYSNKNKLNI